MKIKKKIKTPSKKIIVALVATLVITLGYMGLAWKMQLYPFVKTEEIKDNYQVNHERSKAEKQVSEAIDRDPGKKLENPQTDKPETPRVNEATGKQQANVLLTNTGIFNNIASASGMVTNVVEQDGRCVYVFTNGAQSIEKVSSTLVNPTSTTCATISFSADELTNGVWKVQLRYASNTSEGASSSKEFTK